MKTFVCQCGNPLFFHNTRCLTCERETALCPSCNQVTAVQRTADNAIHCGNRDCREKIQFCDNRQHLVCNGAIFHTSDVTLCRFCNLNDFIPDLSIEGNLAKWQRLEMAKHRVLYTIDQLGFPIIDNDQAGVPQLVFDFKADDQQKVSTGHANGRITINIIEADSAVREQTRVQFGEPQRTLVGHFRHELGHYYWDLLVKPQMLEPFRALFGNEQSPTYQEAQKSYYQNGPLKDWRLRFVSGYASMHPWEDFAETFNAYLDMATIVATTNHFQLTDQRLDDFEGMLEAYKSIGIAANEMNRDMGLLDLVPEVFTEPVQEKLKFVHQLRTIATKDAGAVAEEAESAPAEASH